MMHTYQRRKVMETGWVITCNITGSNVMQLIVRAQDSADKRALGAAWTEQARLLEGVLVSGGVRPRAGVWLAVQLLRKEAWDSRCSTSEARTRLMVVTHDTCTVGRLGSRKHDHMLSSLYCRLLGRSAMRASRRRAQRHLAVSASIAKQMHPATCSPTMSRALLEASTQRFQDELKCCSTAPIRHRAARPAQLRCRCHMHKADQLDPERSEECIMRKHVYAQICQHCCVRTH